MTQKVELFILEYYTTIIWSYLQVGRPTLYVENDVYIFIFEYYLKSNTSIFSKIVEKLNISKTYYGMGEGILFFILTENLKWTSSKKLVKKIADWA